MIEFNFLAADAYDARICDEIAWLEKAVGEFPPTCECCERAGFEDDRAYCFALKEWNEGCECIDTDFFRPNPKWEAYQPSW